MMLYGFNTELVHMFLGEQSVFSKRARSPLVFETYFLEQGLISKEVALASFTMPGN